MNNPLDCPVLKPVVHYDFDMLPSNIILLSEGNRIIGGFSWDGLTRA